MQIIKIYIFIWRPSSLNVFSDNKKINLINHQKIIEMLNFPNLKKCNISIFFKKKYAHLLFQTINYIPEEIFLIKRLYEKKVHRIISHMALIE